MLEFLRYFIPESPIKKTLCLGATVLTFFISSAATQLSEVDEAKKRLKPKIEAFESPDDPEAQAPLLYPDRP